MIEGFEGIYRIKIDGKVVYAQAEKDDVSKAQLCLEDKDNESSDIR